MVVVTRTPLSEIRVAIATAVTSLPAYSTPPDDVAQIPCVVVNGPDGERTNGIGGIWTLEFVVVVVGRRYDMTEVHTELDDAMWQVVADLDESDLLTLYGVTVNRFERDTTEVGGQIQPTYNLTLAGTTVYCS